MNTHTPQEWADLDRAKTINAALLEALEDALRLIPPVQYFDDPKMIAARAAIALAKGQKHQRPAWLPIETAPKDGTAILGWCDHEADPYHDGDNLTIYGAHTDGLSHATDGPVVVEWGGAFDDSTWESPGPSLPDWWFQRGSDDEIAANPTHWLPIPDAPKAAS